MPAAIASAGRWPESARPRKTIAAGVGAESCRTAPSSGCSCPEPFSPSRPTISPARRRQDRCRHWRARAPKQRTIPRILRSAVIAGLRRLRVARRRLRATPARPRTTAQADRAVLGQPPGRASFSVGAIFIAPLLNCAAMSPTSFTTAAGTTGLNALPSARTGASPPVTGAVS